MNGPPRGVRRRAFTLVEVMLFSAIGLVVISAVWFVFVSALRRGANTDELLQAVQGTIAFCRVLERDLDALYEDTGHRIGFQRRGDDSSLEFHAFAPESAEGEWEPTRLVKVRYEVEGATGALTRRVGERPPHRFPGTFEQLGVRFVDPAVEAPEDGPIPSITVAVTALSFRALRKPREERTSADRTVVFVTAPRRTVAAPLAYPFWNPVPHGPGEPVTVP